MDNRSVRERFDVKVNKDGPIPEHKPELGPCWVWTAGKDKNGYGYFCVDGKTLRAHRWAYQEFHDHSPGDLLVCHSCDNPSCVRPDHLFLGTNAENMQDMWDKGRGWDGDKNGRRKYPHLYKGERNPNAKLTDFQVAKIRELHGEQNYSQRELAQMFDVSRAHIYNIVKGKQRNG